MTLRTCLLLTLGVALTGCLEDTKDPRPLPEPVEDLDGGRFEPGPRPSTMGGPYGSGSGSGSGSGAPAPADAEVQDAGVEDAAGA